MRDGQLFHILTFGQGNMPAHAAQLSREDRWKAVVHIRTLQSKAPAETAPSAGAESPASEAEKETAP